MQHLAVQPDSYRDRKRYAWLLSLLVPGTIAAGPFMYYATGNALALWIPFSMSYAVIPVLDFLIGEDRSNPPEEAVPRLEADRYYRYVTYALVPLLWAGFIFGVWFFTSHDLPLHARIAGILATGSIGGFGINLGHELGHKRAELERWLAKIVLSMTGYGHFSIEHNRGHHRDVATPEDPASARMGENIYRFVLREMPGAFRRSWLLEQDRLQRNSLPVWSLHNEILQGLTITVVFFSAMTVWLGPQALPFLFLASFWSNFQLTSANYIEHYGLLRRKVRDANGLQDAGGLRYERCQPHHSWNSNRLLSNWALFHLQRHSDHHSHPGRRYQTLRHFEDVPQLPNGYFGMFTIAYIPPLWYRVMDRRLVEAVGRDASRINFDAARRDALIARYGLRSDGMLGRQDMQPG